MSDFAFSEEQTPPVAGKPKLLIVCDAGQDRKELVGKVNDHYEPVLAESVAHGVSLLATGQFEGVLLANASSKGLLQAGALIDAARILESFPDGVVLLGHDLSILWANKRFSAWCSTSQVVGQNFYEALGTPEILGPDFSPLSSALGSAMSGPSTVQVDGNRFFQVVATPLAGAHGANDRLLVLVRDVTSETLQQQKLTAIHRAGVELADLTPAEVARMTVDERIELLKANIIHHTKHLLDFDTVEIRLLDRETGRLELLLAEGMAIQASERELFAEPHGNGVTGFVAATGKSYLCENTAHDPLYLPGAPDAKSSLTVPLILHDEVIGTFNVESPDIGAFEENDRLFLEIFSRDVAAAVNTLELLVAEKMTTATESVEAIHREVALPVDEILNDVVGLLDRYIGHDEEATERMRRILDNAREIKQLIQKVGEEMTPSVAHPPVPARPSRPTLREQHVLVADNDATVRRAAHELLGRYGCVVETTHDGREAVGMARTGHYDVVLADVRLPDMSGYECFCQLRGVLAQVPIILMTGFGYDPTHSIVKARQEGLQGILYKPFRVDQLLDAVETAVTREK
jgi:CheY-like chemotaxis protein